jgi:hypothetical protein
VPSTSSLLSPAEESALAFDRRVFARPAVKDEAILGELGMTPAQHYLILARLLDSPDAWAYDPLLVERLHRRLRPTA